MESSALGPWAHASDMPRVTPADLQLMSSTTPSISVLPDRPAFVRRLVRHKNGSYWRWATDSVECACFLWRADREHQGRAHILGLTDKNVRLPKPKRRRPAPG